MDKEHRKQILITVVNTAVTAAISVLVTWGMDKLRDRLTKPR